MRAASRDGIDVAEMGPGQAGGRRVAEVPGAHGRPVLRVEGVLDAALGARLVEAVDAAVATDPGIRLDLRRVEAWSAEGLERLAECVRLGARLDAR
jgi:hypothetical protein